MEIANKLEVLNLSDELYSIFVPSTMHKALSCMYKHEKPLINKVMGLAHIKKCALCGQTTKNIPRTFTVWREFDEGARGLLSFLCSAQSWRLKFFMQNSIQ